MALSLDIAVVRDILNNAVKVTLGPKGRNVVLDKAVANYLNGGDWRITGEFTEVESGKRSDRPELARALAAARLHHIPVVVVDRLTRSVAFLSRLLEAGVLPAIEGPTGRFMRA